MNDLISSSIDNIYKINLAVGKTEKVIVFTDGYNAGIKKIAKLIADAGRQFTSDINYIQFKPTGCHGAEPPEKVWNEVYGKNVLARLKERKLFDPLVSKHITKEQIKEIEKIVSDHKDEAADVVIALSYFSSSHTRFRDMLNRICGARYASMPLFDELMLEGPMTVDLVKMTERTEYIAERVNLCEAIEIDSPNGTSLVLSKKGREAKMDTGLITKPGSFSNLPAGEVYLAPLEGTAQGRLVIEWAPTFKLNDPIILNVSDGMVRHIDGKGKYAESLEATLSERSENRNIAELGIGTNDRAIRPDNILESEKIFGTIHIALGDNSSFGGTVSTSFHQDFVFFEPDLTLISENDNREVLMKKGRLIKRV